MASTLVVTALVAQSLVIGGLLVQRRRRRRAELALRDLSGRLLTAQEEERRRIARELHDNVNQQMASLAIRIDQLAASVGDIPTTVTTSIRDLRQRAVDISTEIHNLSHRLHSSRLEMLGLVDALRAHCQELVSQGVEVRFHHDNVPRSLPPEAALCLFRVAQEALNNVVKHSGVREAQVTLRANGGMVLLNVADFGRGFDESRTPERGGLGLASMRERLRLLGGEFTVRSAPGQGTTITARLPVPESGAKADTEQVA